MVGQSGFGGRAASPFSVANACSNAARVSFSCLDFRLTEHLEEPGNNIERCRVARYPGQRDDIAFETLSQQPSGHGFFPVFSFAEFKGLTPLQLAVLGDGIRERDAKQRQGLRREACVRCAGLLLDAGAPIDAQEQAQGATALHIASRLCRTEMARLLVHRGANANVIDSRGRTPLDVLPYWCEGLDSFFRAAMAGRSIQGAAPVKATAPAAGAP